MKNESGWTPALRSAAEMALRYLGGKSGEKERGFIDDILRENKIDPDTVESAELTAFIQIEKESRLDKLLGSGI